MFRLIPRTQINLQSLFKVKFNFAKIIKLASKQTQPSIDQSILKSVITAQDIFKQFSTQPIKSINTQTAISNPSFIQQYFINFVNTIDQQSLQTKLNNSQINANLLIKKIKSQKILQNAVECLIGQVSFTSKQKDYVTNLFLIMSQLFKKNIYEGRKGELDIGFFREFMETFNQYMILMHMEPKLVMNYLFLINHLIKTKTVDSSRAYFVNQKIVIDHILENKSKYAINKRDLLPLLTYLSLGNVISNYPQQYYQFVDFLLQKLDPKWYNDPVFKNKRFIISLYNLNYRSGKIINGLKQIMDTKEINQQNYDCVVVALNSYINLKAELYHDKKNEYPQEITKPLERILQFVKSLKLKNKGGSTSSPSQTLNSHSAFSNKYSVSNDDMLQQIYKTLIPTLFRCSIWLQSFWLQFAQWLDIEQNYQKLPIIQIYTIMDLIKIDHDIIPKIIIDRLAQCKQNMLLKNNFRIQDVDLIKVYHKQFGQRMKGFYTSQQQIANNLRSVSKINVKTQSLINFFLVDILMNGNIIIEINNQMHYIMDEGQTGRAANVKSAFRKRILQKLGYKFMEFEIDMFSEGNYEFLKIVEKQFLLPKNQIKK